MIKPIFIIRFPYIPDQDRERFERHHEQISEQLSDYHVLSLIDGESERVEFECYNSPHTEIEFEEIKKMVMETLKVSQ
jgi:hypothetical protein